MILLASQRQGWVAPVTAVLGWKNTGFSGRTGREDEEVVVSSVSDQPECMEPHLDVDKEPAWILRVRIKARAGTGGIMVGKHYRLPVRMAKWMRPSVE